MNVVKRSGKVVPFNGDLIRNAILACFDPVTMGLKNVSNRVEDVCIN